MVSQRNTFTTWQRAVIWALYSAQRHAEGQGGLLPDSRVIVTRRGISNMLGFDWGATHSEKMLDLVKRGLVTWHKMDDGVYAYRLTNQQLDLMRQRQHIVSRECYTLTKADMEIPF
jgi:hypothetical protein